MQREKHKWLKPRGESTDVEQWDRSKGIESGGCISVQLATG